MSYDYLFKIIIIGDGFVGKTALVERITRNDFRTCYNSTIGVDFSSYTLDINEDTIKTYIWDTAGQKCFSSIISAYYSGIAGAVIVFDVTNRESYEKVSYWLNEIKMSNTTENKPVIILVGNKIDAQDRTVSKTEAESFASANDMMYYETSAKQNINVQQCYRVLIEKIYNGIDPETISDNNGIRRGPSTHTKVKTIAMRKHICCVDKCCTII